MNIYIESDSLTIRFDKIKNLVTIYLNKIDKIQNELDDLKTKGHEIQDEIDTLLYDIKSKNKPNTTKKQNDELPKQPPKYPQQMINKGEKPAPPSAPKTMPPPPIFPPKKSIENKNIPTIPSFLKPNFLKQSPIKPEQNESISDLKSKTLSNLKIEMLNELARLKEVMGKT